MYEHANNKTGGRVRLKLQRSHHQNVRYQLADNQAHQALSRYGSQLREETVDEKAGHQGERTDDQTALQQVLLGALQQEDAQVDAGVQVPVDVLEAFYWR